jgi:Uma2 family endonuclease
VATAFPLHRYTFADYLRLEEESSTRHEFLEGEIVAMAGGTPEHAALAMAVGRQLGNPLEGSRCRVFSSDLRIKVAETGLVTYPDVTAICGRTERDAESSTTILNPILLVEVTSDSTEHFDRGVKLEHYMKIPSLQAIVLVSHREHRIDVYERTDGDWTQHSADTGSSKIAVASAGVTFDLDALYAAAAEPA